MKERWNELAAKALLSSKGVRFEGKRIIRQGASLGNGGGGAYDYLRNYCGYK